jgi:hypothetical protein
LFCQDAYAHFLEQEEVRIGADQCVGRTDKVKEHYETQNGIDAEPDEADHNKGFVEADGTNQGQRIADQSNDD